MIEEIKKKVSRHAAERFIKRAMGIELTAENYPSEEMLIAVSLRMIQLIDQTFPGHESIPDGHFSIKSDDVIFVKEEGKLVTVKYLSAQPGNEPFKGGLPRRLKNKRAKNGGRLPKEFY